MIREIDSTGGTKRCQSKQPLEQANCNLSRTTRQCLQLIQYVHRGQSQPSRMMRSGGDLYIRITFRASESRSALHAVGDRRADSTNRVTTLGTDECLQTEVQRCEKQRPTNGQRQPKVPGADTVSCDGKPNEPAAVPQQASQPRRSTA